MTQQPVVVTGASGIKMYRATVIKHALLFYARTSMRINTAYTPKRMLQIATEYTGNTYKMGQYVQAAADLQEWLDDMHMKGNGHDQAPSK